MLSESYFMKCFSGDNLTQGQVLDERAESANFVKEAADNGDISAMLTYVQMVPYEEEKNRYIQIAAEQGNLGAKLSMEVMKHSLHDKR